MRMRVVVYVCESESERFLSNLLSISIFAFDSLEFALTKLQLLQLQLCALTLIRSRSLLLLGR